MTQGMAGAPLTIWLRCRVSDVMEPVPVVVAAGERPAGVLARLLAANGAAQAVVVDDASYGPLLPALERALGVDAGQLAEPARTKAAQIPLAVAMLDEGRSATEVQAVLAALNDQVVARVVAGAVQALAADGWGEAPAPFTMIQMGSAGRCENFLRPDQDHGLTLQDYPDQRHNAVDRWFIALAERLARDLERAGYPLCDGNVMAINPLWRKRLREWLDQVVYWTRSRSNQAILQADIFFDFRPVYEPPEPAVALRRHVTAVARDARPFLAQMCWRQREQGNPLGLFGHLPKNPIDLKLRGLPAAGRADPDHGSCPRHPGDRHRGPPGRARRRGRACARPPRGAGRRPRFSC